MKNSRTDLLPWPGKSGIVPRAQTGFTVRKSESTPATPLRLLPEESGTCLPGIRITGRCKIMKKTFRRRRRQKSSEPRSPPRPLEIRVKKLWWNILPLEEPAAMQIRGRSIKVVVSVEKGWGQNVEWHFVKNSFKKSLCQNYSKNTYGWSHQICFLS